MRKLLFFITILLTGTFAFSCGDSVTTHALLEAERLADTNPDSALSILDTLNPSRLRNNDERMLRRLLILEAYDKKFIPHKDDKEINVLLDYFIEGNRLTRIHPLVYYYAGRVNSDLNEDAKALAYYKKALEELPKCNIPSLESRIRAQRAGIYQKHKLFRHSIPERKAFLSIAKQNKDTVDLICGSLSLASNYKLNNNIDSARLIYENIEEMVKEYNDSVLITTFYSQYAHFYFKIEEYEKADSLINLYPEHTDITSAQSVNFIRNKINQQFHKSVSSEQFALLLKNNHPGYRFSGNLGLAKIAVDNKKPEEALKYITGAYTSMQEIQKMYSENSLAEMEKIIDESELENKAIRLENENEKKMLYLILVSVVAIAVGLALVLVVHRANLAKTRKDLEMESMKIENLRMIRELEKKLANSETLSEDRKRRIDEFEDSIALENVIDEITDLISSPPALPTEDHLKRLQKAFAKSDPDFIAALDGLHLSKALYNDALLTKIHVPTKRCAEFLGTSLQNVYSSRNRFLKKISNGEKPKNWIEFIQSL